MKHEMAVGILSIVLANKDESSSLAPTVPSSPVASASRGNKYSSMPFTLDDAVIQARNEKSRVLFGVIPGEAISSSAIISNSLPSSQESTTTSAPSLDVNNNNNDNDDPVTTTNPVNETKDSPAEGTITITADLDTDGSDGKNKDEADQRIVFIERLMGLHLAAAASAANSSPSEENPSGPASDDDDDIKDNKRVKWSSSRSKKFPESLQESVMSQGVPLGEPHPMLRYAAAAMMSRLIAAAARAQMESQAREQAMMIRGLLSPLSAKDKDDTDAEEESVPVLLASIRSERTMSPIHHSMYGRPSLSARNSRGPLDLGMPSVASRSKMMMMASNGLQGNPAAVLHPLLQHLQTLQALSALQRMQQQEQRPSRSRGEAGHSERLMMDMMSDRADKSGPALVMVAIPIGDQPEASEMRHRAYPYRSYNPYSSHPHSPAYPVYRAPPMNAYPSYPPQMHASYGFAMNAPLASSRSAYFAHPHAYPPHPFGASSRLPPHPHSHNHYPHHHQYSMQGRPVIEVPIEVPVPVHVPVHVPVAYPSGPSQVQPAYHGLPAHTVVGAAAAAGRIASEESSSSSNHDNSPSDSDQIVLFYDADLPNESEGSNGHQQGVNHQSNHQEPHDDLQSSASEHKAMYGASKGHHFLSSHPMPAGPSLNKMKLFREMMAQKHASQPGIRYFPVAVQSEVEQEAVSSKQQQQLQKQLKLEGLSAESRLTVGKIQEPDQQQIQQQPNGQQEHQSAFLVIQDERNQPQAVERRR